MSFSELLHFVFSGFFHFIGSIMLISVVCTFTYHILSRLLNFIEVLCRGYKKDDDYQYDDDEDDEDDNDGAPHHG